MIRNPFILINAKFFPKIRLLKICYKNQNILLYYRNIYDLAIIFEMFVTGVYREDFIINSDVIADVWWHCGYFAVWASCINPDIKIYSFEPDEANREIFQKNISINNLSNIQLSDNWLWKKEEEITLYRYENGADNSFMKYKNRDAVWEYKVKIKDANDVLYKINPMFLKIDIEWMEEDVLYAYINNWWKPKYISVEFSTTDKATHEEKIEKFIKNQDYNHIVDDIIVNSILI